MKDIIKRILTIAIGFLLISCEKTGVVKPYGFIDVDTIDAEPSGNFEIVYDTIPVEEYFRVTSKISSSPPDSIWSDTIYNVIERPLSRWLEDGLTFLEDRKDTTIVYLNGTQGVWFSEEWYYWTLED